MSLNPSDIITVVSSSSSDDELDVTTEELQDAIRTSSTNQQDAIRTSSTNQQDAIRTSSTNQQDAIGTSSTNQQGTIRTSSTNQQDTIRTSSTNQHDAIRMSLTNLQDAIRTSTTIQLDAIRTSLTNQQNANRTSSTSQQVAVRTSSTNQQDAVRTSSTNQQHAIRTSSTNQQDAIRTSSTNQQGAIRTTSTNQQDAIQTSPTNLQDEIRTSLTNQQNPIQTSSTDQQDAIRTSTTSQQAADQIATTEDQRVSIQPARVCLVCGSSQTFNCLFIQPCRCGYWVHDQCLVNVVLQFENQTPNSVRSVGCKHCRRAYNIHPSNNFVLRVVSIFSDWYNSFCDTCFLICFQFVADITSIKVGSVILDKIYGTEAAVQVVSLMTPMSALLTCQLIPIASIVICSIPWEYEMLKGLRRCSKIPLLGGLFPQEYQIADKSAHSSNYINLFGGLILPFYGVATGKLYTNVVEEPFQQFLLGTASIVLLQGIGKMYYKQKKYVQYCTLRVLDSNS